jgi:hypothetical protein
MIDAPHTELWRLHTFVTVVLSSCKSNHSWERRPAKRWRHPIMLWDFIAEWNHTGYSSMSTCSVSSHSAITEHRVSVIANSISRYSSFRLILPISFVRCLMYVWYGMVSCTGWCDYVYLCIDIGRRCCGIDSSFYRGLLLSAKDHCILMLLERCFGFVVLLF